MERQLKIKRVILDPDPRLRAPNAEVTEPWEDLESRVDRMFRVMYRTGNGVGLSAPQVGWNVRLFVMNSDKASKKPQFQRVYWNPKIIEKWGDQEKLTEGCLSLPKVFGKIYRYPKIQFEAMTRKGPVHEVFEGLAAQIVQHEVGHLNGEMCWDRFLKSDA